MVKILSLCFGLFAFADSPVAPSVVVPGKPATESVSPTPSTTPVKLPRTPAVNLTPITPTKQNPQVLVVKPNQNNNGNGSGNGGGNNSGGGQGGGGQGGQGNQQNKNNQPQQSNQNNGGGGGGAPSQSSRSAAPATKSTSPEKTGKSSASKENGLCNFGSNQGEKSEDCRTLSNAINDPKTCVGKFAQTAIPHLTNEFKKNYCPNFDSLNGRKSEAISRFIESMIAQSEKNWSAAKKSIGKFELTNDDAKYCAGRDEPSSELNDDEAAERLTQREFRIKCLACRIASQSFRRLISGKVQVAGVDLSAPNDDQKNAVKEACSKLSSESSTPAAAAGAKK